MRRRRDIGRVATQEGPEHLRVLAVGDGGEVEQHGEGDRRAGGVGLAGTMQHFRRGRMTGVDVPDGIAETVLPVLPLVAAEELQIFIHRAWNGVEIETLGLARLLVHEQRQAFRARVGEPLVDGQAIALRLRDLLTLLVEKELVVEALGRLAAKRAHDVARQLDRVDQILAGHFVIDLQRVPAHGPVRLPLQLAMAAGDGRLECFAGVGIAPRDRARLDVHRLQRHLHDDAGARMNGQEGRIGRGALLAQRGQHDRLHLIEAVEHAQQRRVEAARRVIVGRGSEFVVEAEAVEEGAQARVVGRAERGIFARKRIGNARQRLAEMARQHVLVRHVVGHLAQAVHVVGESQQTRLDPPLGQHLERVPHHGRACDLAERADVRQARGPVAGLEQHLGRAGFRHAGDELFRFLEGPGGGQQGGGVKR